MGAKSRYVPLLLRWPGGNTYLRLFDRFGYAGIVIWTNYLVACKRNDPEGQLEYTSDENGWHKLDLGPPLTPDFPLGDVWRLTGHMHNTTKRRIGQRTVIVCRRWDDVNRAWRSQQRAEQRAAAQAAADSSTTVSRRDHDDSTTNIRQPPRKRNPRKTEESAATPVAAMSPRAPGSEAEEVQGLRPTAEQNRTGPTRATPTPTSALPDQSTEEPEPLDPFADVVARIAANGQTAPPGSVERILEAIPVEDQDTSTYETIRRAIDPLTVHSTEMLREELLAAGPEIRNRARYAVKIAQRMAAGRRPKGTKR